MMINKKNKKDAIKGRQINYTEQFWRQRLFCCQP